MSGSLGSRLRAAFVAPNPAIPVTAIAVALPAAYVVAAAVDESTASFFALLLVGVRVPWLAGLDDPATDSGSDSTADAADSTPESTVSTPRAVLWTTSTGVVVAAAFLGLYVAGVALSIPADAASPVAFFAAWVLPEAVVGGPGR